MVPTPRGLTFEEWSAFVAEMFAAQGLNMFDGVREGGDWREWGERLRQLDALSILPETATYARWNDWAERVVDFF